MSNLKLAKLPDRRNVKITVAVPPDLHGALEAYAETYRETYGEAEEVSVLIPYMLEQFLASDRFFAKVRRTASGPAVANGHETRVRTRTSAKEET